MPPLLPSRRRARSGILQATGPTQDCSLAQRANKERHPCKARRRRVPGARDWAPAGARQGEPQECLRVSTKTPHPGRACETRVCPLEIPAQQAACWRGCYAPSTQTLCQFHAIPKPVVRLTNLASNAAQFGYVRPKDGEHVSRAVVG